MNKITGRTIILTGGFLEKAFVEKFLSKEIFDTIICVDGALRIADELSLKLDWLVGDFDSVSTELLNKYESMIASGIIHTNIRKYKPEKDATDTQIAIELAMDLEAYEIVLLGGVGSRMDHTLGNINLLLKPLYKGIKAYIINENNKIYTIDNTTKIKKSEQYGNYVSLLPFTEQVTKVTLLGFQYPLTEYSMTIGESIGISNEIMEEEATIRLEKGVLIVIESKD